MKQVLSWAAGKYRRWINMLRDPYVDRTHMRVVDDTGYPWIACIGDLPTEQRPYRHFIMRLWDSFFGARYREETAAWSVAATLHRNFNGYRWSIGNAAGYEYLIPVRVKHLRMGEVEPTLCLSPPYPYFNGCTECTYRTSERYRTGYTCPVCHPHVSPDEVKAEPRVVIYESREHLRPESIMDIRWNGAPRVTLS